MKGNALLNLPSHLLLVHRLRFAPMFLVVLQKVPARCHLVLHINRERGGSATTTWKEKN